MDLSTYTTNVLGMLNDPFNQFYSSTNVTNWINLARVETAKASGCIRLLTPSSSPVTAIAVTGGGSGYSTATVTISGPSAIGGAFVTATATAILSAGSVQSVTVNNPGSGYITAPTVTITGNGTGATATATIGSRLATTAAQEVYNFTTATSVLLDYFPGLGGVIGVLDVAVSWGSMKPSLDYQPWAAFQAYARSINQGQNYPMIWSQFRMGETGSVYLFPIPSTVYEMQWDCFCTPLALSPSQTVDLIPDNWTTPVFYYACYLAYLNAQRQDDANTMMQRWERALAQSNAYATPPRTPSYYSGYE